MKKEDDNGKLRPEDVRFLTFEGGGGKGNAYLGAIKGLIDEKVITYSNNRIDKKKILGISGSSAGAITAVLLALGYEYDKLRSIIQKIDFNKAFELPLVGDEVRVPVNGYWDYSYRNPDKQSSANIPLEVNKFIANFLPLFWAVEKIIDYLIKNALKDDNPILAERISSNKTKYIECLFTDFGMFSGKFIYSTFNQIITSRVNELNTEKYGNKNDSNKFYCSFKMFEEIFGIDLRITSVNFKTENLQIFSASTTPQIPVASAIRMSMSLPAFFKPVVIEHVTASRYNLPGKTWMGHWVDGGLFDNAPIRLFDPKSTLLLRLGNREKNNKIESLTDFLTIWWKNIGVFGAGSGTTTDTTFDMQKIITLNVDNLSLLKFNLDESTLQKNESENFEIVKKYFKKNSPT